MSKYRITLEGKTYEMDIELVPEKETLQPSAHRKYKEYKTEKKDPTVMVIDPASERKTQTANKGAVTSPMPGIVLKIAKGEGEAVVKSELVLVLEAMKMENEILAPVDGKITKMNCTEGNTVEGGAVLFEVSDE